LGLAACQRPARNSMSDMMSSSGMMQGNGSMSSSARGRGEMAQMMGSADEADMQV